MDRRRQPRIPTSKRDFQALFVRLVEQLSAETDANKLVDHIFRDICAYFGIGCGFVYELEGERALRLKEFHQDYDGHRLPWLLGLDDMLTQADLKTLRNQPIFFSAAWGGRTFEHTRFSRLLKANTVLLMPVRNNEGQLKGLIGMADRRHRIFDNDDDVKTANTVLNLLVNYVRLRIYSREREATRALMKGVMDNIGFDIYVTDLYTDELLYTNPSTIADQERVPVIPGRKCWQVFFTGQTARCDDCPKDQVPAFLNDGALNTRPYTWDYERPSDGAWFRVICAAFRWVDTRPVHVVSRVDITETKLYEKAIFHMAYYDQTTRLPKRAKLFSDIGALVERLREASFHVLFFDLDGFKSVNDSLGHQGGDDLLALIARTLNADPLFSGRLYRHGGDEFVVIMETADREDIRAAARRLLRYFQAPWRIAQISVPCRTSIGIAAFPEDGADAQSLIHQADMTMYRAKRNGKNRAFFTNGEAVTPEDEAKPATPCAAPAMTIGQ